MTALASPRTYSINAKPVSASERASEGTLQYFNIDQTDLPSTRLRKLTAIDAMYAYFGSDEVAA